jgi:hypothetical protein
MAGTRAGRHTARTRAVGGAEVVGRPGRELHIAAAGSRATAGVEVIVRPGGRDASSRPSLGLSCTTARWERQYPLPIHQRRPRTRLPECGASLDETTAGLASRPWLMCSDEKSSQFKYSCHFELISHQKSPASIWKKKNRTGRNLAHPVSRVLKRYCTGQPRREVIESMKNSLGSRRRAGASSRRRSKGIAEGWPGARRAARAPPLLLLPRRGAGLLLYHLDGAGDTPLCSISGSVERK